MTTISAEHAEELADAEEGEKVGPWTHVADQAGRSGRWRQARTLVIADEQGQHWGVNYAVGLTENQDHEFPWAGVPDDHQITLVRLFAHTVTTVKYRTKPAEVNA